MVFDKTYYKPEQIFNLLLKNAFDSVKAIRFKDRDSLNLNSAYNDDCWIFKGYCCQSENCKQLTITI
ncbi:MAG: hypothetical protein ACFFCV_13925 [Promethearchaeota archaeon]